MRKLLSLAGLGVIGCSVLPTDAPMRDEAQPSLAATTTTTNQVFPVTIGAFVPCANGGAGEIVLVTGNLHSLVHVTVSDNGNVVLKSHFQPQGLSGQGLTTGAKYQATGVTQDVQTINGNPPWNYTYVNNFRFIGQGPGNNYMVHTNYHVTVNANGDVTVDHDNTSITCS